MTSKLSGNASLPGTIDIGLEVRREDTLPPEFGTPEISGHEYPPCIIGHIVAAHRWNEVRAYLDAKPVSYAWHYMHGNDTSMHYCNGAKWGPAV